MSQGFTFCLVVLMVLAFANPGDDQARICGGVARAGPLSPTAFRAVLDSVAAGSNSNRADLAASCFTEAAVYLEPPNRQLHRGRAELRSSLPPQSPRPGQIGCGGTPWPLTPSSKSALASTRIGVGRTITG